MFGFRQTRPDAVMAIALVALGFGAPAIAAPPIHSGKQQETSMNVQHFAEDYVELWSTTDDKRRKELAEQLFAVDAAHYAAPANTAFLGRDAILANVTNVNKGAIQQAGLKFKSGPSVVNHNSILVEWSAEAPNGQTVRTGRDLLILNDQGKATLLYMFTSN